MNELVSKNLISIYGRREIFPQEVKVNEGNGPSAKLISFIAIKIQKKKYIATWMVCTLYSFILGEILYHILVFSIKAYS